MDLTDLVPDPGAIAAGGSGTGDGLENLSADFSPQPIAVFASDNSSSLDPAISNLIYGTTPTAPMDDLLFDFGQAGETEGDFLNGFGNSTYSSGITSSLLGTAENGLSGLLNAFVINPQNQQTANTAATNAAEISIAKTSQIFGYLLIGFVAFLIFGALKK